MVADIQNATSDGETVAAAGKTTAPAVGQTNPAAGKTTAPAVGQTNPAAGKSAPLAGKASAAGKSAPLDGKAAPAAGKSAPTDGQTTVMAGNKFTEDGLDGQKNQVFVPVCRLRLFFHYVRLNLQAAMSYRVAFFTQFFFMLVNDVFLLFFWWVFFSGFEPSGGWRLNDIFLLYAVSSGIFGLAAVFFGNAFHISRLIQQGELDNFLLNPAPPMFHLVISHSIPAGWGDIAFSFLAFLLSGYLTLYAFLIYLLSLAAGTVIFVSFMIIFNSLAFYIESAEGVSKLLREAVLTFSLYPGDLFSGMIKLLLFTIIPAGFMAYIPVGLIKGFNLYNAVALTGFAAGILALSIHVFYSGLKRYSSGNIMYSRV